MESVEKNILTSCAPTILGVKQATLFFLSDSGGKRVQHDFACIWNSFPPKGYISSELKKAILSVVDGEDYIQPSLIPVLNAKMIDRDMDSEKIEKLTKRELEVLKLLAVGMYNKGVADELHISERTVKNHVSSIFKKIDVSDRTQAAVFAIRNNLISIH